MQIIGRIAGIEKLESEIQEEIRNHWHACFQNALDELRLFVLSENFKERFTSWTLDEIPKKRDSWQDTKDEIIKALSNRLQTFIKQWEEDNKVFENARESLLQLIEKRYNFVERQLRDLRSTVTADDIGVPPAEVISDEHAYTLGEKVIIGATSPIWFPLAVVVGVPLAGALYVKSMLAERNKEKAFEKDKCAFLREESAEYLQSASSQDAAIPFVKQQLRESFAYLVQILNRVSELIEAEKMLAPKLFSEASSESEISERYKPIIDEVSRLRRELTLLGVTEIQAHISSKNLDWKENRSPCLGRGAFGAVYEGVMTVNENSGTVALKVFNEVLDANNSSGYMAMVGILR